VSDEIAVSKRAAKNAGKYQKNLAADMPEHKALLNYRQTITNWLKTLTYEWMGTTRLLPMTRHDRFMAEWAQHVTMFGNLKTAFLTRWPDVVSNQAFLQQGDMFRREDYPTVEMLEHKFSVSLCRSNVPTGDYRVQSAMATAEDLTADYQKQTQRIVQDILVEQAKQLVEVMTSISHCCATEAVVDDKGKVKIVRHRLYESTLQKAIERCDTFAAFNPTGNPELEDARASLQKLLANVNLDALRESDTMKAVVKDEVDSILSKFKF
jgi:hypothetical protein